MKRTLLLLLMFISIRNAYAQDCAPNNITTNPTSPVNNQNPRKKNTFDFTANQFNLNWIYNYNNTTKINSPFFETDNPNINHFYDPIDGIKDIMPCEG